MKDVEYLQLREEAVKDLASVPTLSEPFNEKRLAPFKILWFLIVRQAIVDYVKWRGSSNLSNKREAEDARRWLFEESDLSNSMEVACQVLDINKEMIRDLASRLTPKDIRKMEFQDRGNYLPRIMSSPYAKYVGDFLTKMGYVSDGNNS